MKKIKLTCAHAIVKHLIFQKILIDGKKKPLFAGTFGIFGHGNVACLGQTLQENQDKLQLNDLAKLIKNNSKPLADFEDGRRSLILAEGALKSVKSKKFEKLNY